LVGEAFHIDGVVRNAVASHSISPSDIEAEIRKTLLPRYFSELGGLDQAQLMVDRIVEIVRLGVSRGTFKTD
jgi:type I restriction enzyme R subunit